MDGSCPGSPTGCFQQYPGHNKHVLLLSGINQSFRDLMICILCGYIEIRVVFFEKTGLCSRCPSTAVLCERAAHQDQRRLLVAQHSIQEHLVFNFFMAQLNGPHREKLMSQRRDRTGPPAPCSPALPCSRSGHFGKNRANLCSPALPAQKFSCALSARSKQRVQTFILSNHARVDV